jgi:chromosomal replication initiator protein
MTTRDFYLLDTWAKSLDFIKNNPDIDKSVFNFYYKDSKLYDLNQEKAIILVNNFICKTVLDSGIELINDSLKTVLDTSAPIKAEIYIEHKFFSEIKEPIKKQKTNYFNKKLNNNYTFENFVVGKSNNHAYVASLSCATKPGDLYNPLFMYGNSGLGKTHLLNSIGNLMKKHNPDLKVALVTGLDFVDCVYKSIKNGDIDEFKSDMYDLDLLLVDDVQFIANKEKTHEIFFSIFNELVNNRKQICLTSDRMPSEINGLQDRIISRFNSGLSVNIETPELTTSINILKLKIANSTELTKEIDDEAITYLATNFSSDVRKLEGALNRLLFYSINFSETNEISLEVAKLAFSDQINSKTSSAIKEVNVNKIKKVVADYYHLTQQQLVSKSRTRNISSARHIALYLSRKLLDLPYVKIGKEFGNRDHSTVMNSYNKINKLLVKDETLQKAIMDLEKKIRG